MDSTSILSQLVASLLSPSTADDPDFLHDAQETAIKTLNDHITAKQKRAATPQSVLGRFDVKGKGKEGNLDELGWDELLDRLNNKILMTQGVQASLHFSRIATQLRAHPLPTQKASLLAFLLSLSTQPPPPPTPAPLVPQSSPSQTSTIKSAGTSTITTTNPKPSTSSKPSLATRLAQHRQTLPLPFLPPVPERLLLRSIIYTLQGISSPFIRFLPPPETPLRPYHRGVIEVAPVVGGEEEEGGYENGIEFVLDGTGYSIPMTTRTLLHQLSELGYLYRKIQSVIAVNSEAALGVGYKEGGGGGGREPPGMMEQALYAAVRKELGEYFKLVAEIEDRFAQGSGGGGVAGGGEIKGEGGGDGELTLRKLGVWVGEWELRMRLMATLVDEAGKELEGGGRNTGGILLTSLHSRTSHGDPFISSFASSLLRSLAVPFLSTLSSWIYDGELRDPFHEFFVEVIPASDKTGGGGEEGNESGGGMVVEDHLGDEEEEGGGGGRGGGREAWEGKFRFRGEMLPAFLEEGLGRKIFSTGKSLNFMKYSCQDAAWVAEHNRSDGASRVLQYADMVGLERSISTAYSAASQRLCALFYGPFKLLDHLKALKDYLLLGKGDFVEILMENLGPSLARPAHTLYRHNLTATLESALKGSTSTTSPDILRRLDARMLEFTQGELGWDVFTLEYKVEAPLSTILDRGSLREYLRLFKYLWQIKRVEWCLNGVWRRLMTGARTVLAVPKLAFTFHQTRLALSEMIFFIRQLQYYCHLEVIAVAYNAFEEEALKPGADFDTLLEAHRTYVKRLVSKALLRPEGWRQSAGTLDTVRNIFKTILSYQETADVLCNYALEEASRADTFKDAGRGLPPSPLLSFPHRQGETALIGIETRLDEFSSTFRSLAQGLIATLGKAPDGDLRFLAVRMNYNYSFVGGKGDMGTGGGAAPASASASTTAGSRAPSSLGNVAPTRSRVA